MVNVNGLKVTGKENIGELNPVEHERRYATFEEAKAAKRAAELQNDAERLAGVDVSNEPPVEAPTRYDSLEEARMAKRLHDDMNEAERIRDIPVDTLDDPSLAAQGAYVTVEGIEGKRQVFVGTP